MSYLFYSLTKYFTIFYLAIRVPRKYIKNWATLYTLALLGGSHIFTAKDGSRSEKIPARKLFKCLVVTEYIYRGANVDRQYRKISLDGKWMKVAVLSHKYELKVQPEKILIVSIPDIFSRIYDVDVKGMVMLDVGAYIGDSALYFLNRGAEKVIAVEPVPEHYEMLVENAKGRSIIPINAAVGEKVPLLPSQIGHDKYGLKFSEKETRQYLDVPVYSLLELIDRWRPQAVKLNCEGCEYSVIESIAQLPKYGVRIIIVQFHEKEGRSIEKALSYLQMHLGAPRITESVTVKNPRVTCIWEFTPSNMTG